jgi:hypothetical protein
MLGTDWILIDTETAGFAERIYVVELAARRSKTEDDSVSMFGSQ